MKYIINFLVFGFFSFALGEQDLSNENIYINKVKDNNNVENIETLKNNFYKENADVINSTVKNIELESKKREKEIKGKFSGFDENNEVRQKARNVVEGLNSDKRMKRWIKEFTKNIYYKELYKGKALKGDSFSVEYQILENYNKIINGKFPAFLSFDSVLASDERIYIFLSSSVPDSTWRSYIKSVRLIGSGNIFLVLRGCVGPEGCKKMMPTINYIRRLAFDESMYGSDISKPANIIIDPYLFKYYKIKVVPTLVYARGISVIHQGSEGFSGNLERKVDDYYKMEGDVSLFYFVNELIDNKRISSEGLKKIKEIGLGL